jgi:hypothetical protein
VGIACRGPAGFAGRLARRLGSLRLAVLLLPVLAVVLFLGTLMESWHDRQVAQQLVYQTWWFVALLVLLGLNILCAALKKRPWKKHQVGFLVTHLGLLVLVGGGLIDSLLGSSGQLFLVDSDSARYARSGRHSAGQAIDRATQVIRVQRSRQHEDGLNAPFDPGPLPWSRGPLPEGAGRVDTLTWSLAALAHPFPRSWSRDTGDGARIEVLTYYPHAREEPFAPGEDDQGTLSPAEIFPAVRLRLASPATGLLPPRWVALQPGRERLGLGPARIEIVAGSCRPEQVHEFCHPPATAALGTGGQLVIGIGGQTHRFDVDSVLREPPMPLGSSGWRLQVEEHIAPGGRGNGHTVRCRLLGPDGTGPVLVAGAERPIPAPAEPDGTPRRPVPPRDFWMWYHPPDQRCGDGAVRGLLQLAARLDGSLFFRSFHGAGLAFEKAGPVTPGGDWQRIWPGMRWQFQVLDYFPQARAGPFFVPLERVPAGEEAPPAIRCRLTRGTATEEFWLGQTDDDLTPVTVGDEQFHVGYNSTLRDLGFRVELLRVEETTDGGTSLRSGQTSFVRLTDPAGDEPGEQRVIGLNRPLTHRGCTLYQGGYQSLGTDEEGRPVGRSRLLVNRDAGAWPKYAGSVMVALGIACMFYMRAYFFKR